MIDILDKSSCCGCTACESVCSHDAITMKADECGFIFPYVNHDLCINCGMCVKVCPLQNEIDFNVPIYSSIAFALDKKEQITSTSGGVASVFSRYIIKERKGVVYGCTGLDCYHVKHIRIDNEEELYLLKGSKYVQSDLHDNFRNVKKDLCKGCDVLFIGTPCQIAGLKGFLRKEYDNLYCIDFVCHGVPSQKILTDAIKSLSLKNIPLSVSFRYKKNKRSKYCLQLTSSIDNKLLYRKEYGRDYYISGFLCALFYRDSCYSCKFAAINRPSDITVGDFWDYKILGSIIDNRDGLSQLHVNTEKGKQMMQMVENYMYTKSIPIERFTAHSEQLHTPMKRHKNYDLFMSKYKIDGFKVAYEESMNHEIKSFKKRRIIRAIPFLYVIYKSILALLKKIN